MEDRSIPETLEEAYRLRDSAESLQERDFYQEQVYHLRREEYRSRGIRTEISSRRRERQSAIEFSREMFFLEVAEISGRTSGRPGGGGPPRPPPAGRRPPPPPRSPRLPQAASLAALGGRRAVPAKLPGAFENGKVPGRGLLPLAGHRARRRVRVPPGRGERRRDRLPDAGETRVHGGAGGDPDPGPARRHDPDSPHLLRLALRLRLGHQDVGFGRDGYHLLCLLGPHRGRGAYVDLRHLYRYLYQVHK